MFCHIDKSNIRNIMSENVGETYKMHTEVCYITDVIKLKEFKASKKKRWQKLCDLQSGVYYLVLML